MDVLVYAIQYTSQTLSVYNMHVYERQPLNLWKIGVVSELLQGIFR